MADDNGGKLEATDGKEHGKSNKGAAKGAKDVPGKKGQGSFFKKYKVWIIVGGLLLLVIGYFLLRSNSGSSSAAASGTPPSNIDPATGFPYGSASDIAALGGTNAAIPTGGSGTGGDGSTGATGAAGPPGPAGKGAIGHWIGSGRAREWISPKFKYAGGYYGGKKWQPASNKAPHIVKPKPPPKHVNPGGPKK